jgi:hypothetical protein
MHLLKVRAEAEVSFEIERAAGRTRRRNGERAALGCVLRVPDRDYGREPIHAAAQEHEHETPIAGARLRRCSGERKPGQADERDCATEQTQCLSTRFHIYLR